MKKPKKLQLTERQLRSRRAREMGLCSICCLREPPGGRKTCTTCSARSGEWQRTNSQRQCERNRQARVELLNAYGHRCACCGEVRKEFLAIDHVNGGGHKERRRLNIRSTRDMVRHIRKQGFPDTYRLLCHNCNLSRGFYGYCPHERAVEAEGVPPEVEEAEVQELTVEPIYE